MYNMMKEHINRGEYRLHEAQDKINKLWVMGHLTDEQRDELLGLMRNGAQAVNEVDLFDKVAELERRVKALESGASSGPVESLPAYQPGKWYYCGDKVTFDGNIYECDAPEGVVCTWSPVEYPTYWKRIEA